MKLKNEIIVSIICNTYNQEKYIKDAIDSFLMQKTSFKYEILIHDDASTDQTKSIICEYVDRYPDIIKPIYQKTNQYSKGISIDFCFQYPRVKGKYVAVCEGDDYWDDPLKLQKQVNLLEENQNINGCAHGFFVVNAGTKNIIEKNIYSKSICIIDVEDVIKRGGGFFSTNSLIFRSCLLSKIPYFFKSYPYDYALQIYISLNNGILYIPDCMSSYRRNAENSWSVAQNLDVNKRLEFNNSTRKMLSNLDQETDSKYHKAIDYALKMVDIHEMFVKKEYSKVKVYPYRQYYKKMTVKEKIIVNMNIYFPNTYSFFHGIFLKGSWKWKRKQK